MAGKTSTRKPRLKKAKISKQNEIEVIEIDDSCPSADEQMGSPLRPIFCLMSREHIRSFEEKEDCFILEYDPYESADVLKLSYSDNVDDGELLVLSEKGQVACRDFPHPRHTCVKYPFEKTPHEDRCELCYCYVCDTAAPCPKWTGLSGHCHAFNNEAWESEKRSKQQRPKQSISIVIN